MNPLTLFLYCLSIAGGIVVIRASWMAMDVAIGAAIAWAKVASKGDQ